MLDDPDTLRLAAVDRGPDDPAIGQRHPVESAEYGPVINGRRTHQYEVPADVLRAGTRDDLPDSVDVTPTRCSVAVAPMLASGRTLGVLAVRRTLRRRSTDLELEVLETFAQEVGESLLARRAPHRPGAAEHPRGARADRPQPARRGDAGPDRRCGSGSSTSCRSSSDPDLRAELDRSARATSTTPPAGCVTSSPASTGTTSAEDFVDVLRSITSSKAGRAQDRLGRRRSRGRWRRLRDDERAELLRVVNEAVSNVVRHARASRVDVDARGARRPRWW